MDEQRTPEARAEGRLLEDLATPLSAEAAGVPAPRGPNTAAPAPGVAAG